MSAAILLETSCYDIVQFLQLSDLTQLAAVTKEVSIRFRQQPDLQRRMFEDALEKMFEENTEIEGDDKE